MRRYFKPILVLVALVLALCITVRRAGPHGHVDVGAGEPLRAAQKDDKRPYDLAALRIFNNTLMRVNDSYVDPTRVDPKQMLLIGARPGAEVGRRGARRAARADDKVIVRVDTAQQEFGIGEVDSPWALSMKMKEIFRFIAQNLPPGTDSETVRNIEYAATNGMLSTLDPHSMLLDPQTYTEMKLTTRGSFGGLGIVIGMRKGELTVIKPYPDTPASKAGIKAGDRIIRIDNESTVNMLHQRRGVAPARRARHQGRALGAQARRAERGGQEDRADARHRVDAHRRLKMLKGNVGLIKLHGNFAGNTDDELRKALEELKSKGDEGAGRSTCAAIRAASSTRRSRSPTSSSTPAPSSPRSATPTSSARRSAPAGHAAARADGRARQRRLGLGLGDRGRRAQEPRPRGDHRQPHLRQGLGAGALRQRRRLGAQADHRAVPDAGRRVDPVGGHHARRRCSTRSLVDKDKGVWLFRDYKGMQRGRPRGAPEVEVHAQAGDKPFETIKYLALEPRRRSRPRRRARRSATRTRTTTTPSDRSGRAKTRHPTDPDALVEDYEVDFARDLVTQAKGWKRREVLASSKPFFDKKLAEEQARIVEALKKLGIDWTPVGAAARRRRWWARSSTDKPQNAVAAGETIKFTAKITNKGPGVAGQVRATLKGDDPFFEGREFVFGAHQAGRDAHLHGAGQDAEGRAHAHRSAAPRGLRGARRQDARSTPTSCWCTSTGRSGRSSPTPTRSSTTSRATATGSSSAASRCACT